MYAWATYTHRRQLAIALVYISSGLARRRRHAVNPILAPGAHTCQHTCLVQPVGVQVEELARMSGCHREACVRKERQADKHTESRCDADGFANDLCTVATQPRSFAMLVLVKSWMVASHRNSKLVTGPQQPCVQSPLSHSPTAVHVPLCIAYCKQQTGGQAGRQAVLTHDVQWCCRR